MKEKDLIFMNSIRNSDQTRFFLEDPRVFTLEETQAWFESKEPEWFIIEVEDQKVGYFRTSENTKKSICIGCDIDPGHRRKGYAKKAYNEFIKKLYSEGFVNIWLDVFRDNEPAINLYKSLGFIEVGSREVRSKDYVTMVHVKDVL